MLSQHGFTPVQGTSDLTTLNDRHREIARLKIAGYMNTEIARELGLAPGTVSQIVNSPLFKLHLEEMHAERDDKVLNITSIVQKGAVKGATLLANILTPNTVEYEAASMKEKVSAARDLLDREGTAPRISRTQSSTANLTMTMEDLQTLMRDSRDVGDDLPPKQVIDVTQGK